MKHRMFGIALVAGAAVVAVASLLSTAMAGPPNACPAIWAPVICDDGKVYPNQCEADKKKAKNCVPYGEL
jgi:hypothetical protein